MAGAGIQPIIGMTLSVDIADPDRPGSRHLVERQVGPKLALLRGQRGGLREPDAARLARAFGGAARRSAACDHPRRYGQARA
jgi:hypothetical protein